MATNGLFPKCRGRLGGAQKAEQYVVFLGSQTLNPSCGSNCHDKCELEIDDVQVKGQFCSILPTHAQPGMLPQLQRIQHRQVKRRLLYSLATLLCNFVISAFQRDRRVHLTDKSSPLEFNVAKYARAKRNLNF